MSSRGWRGAFTHGSKDEVRLAYLPLDAVLKMAAQEAEGRAINGDTLPPPAAPTTEPTRYSDRPTERTAA